MARLGIDYGTTNTVAVASDRGLYPVVPHTVDSSVGTVVREVFPSLVTFDREAGRFLFGADAERSLLRPDAEARFGIIRSLKRLIRDYAEGLRIQPDVVPGGFDPSDVLGLFAKALRASILRSGNIGEGEPLEAVLTWPANANGAQRHLTRRCFRDAGFGILGVLSEPVASAIEFADRLARGSRPEARRLVMNVAIFDLGGGTFDVSLVRIEGSDYTVVDASGIEKLGGDDFDELLARRFAKELGIDFDGLSSSRRSLLLMQACRQKEGIGLGTTRNLSLSPEDLGFRGSPCSVPVRDFLSGVRGLLAPAVDRLSDLLHGEAARAAGIRDGNVDAIYLVGGSSKLPVVPGLIEERFPKTKRILSDKPFTSAAMGAAIQSVESIRLHDILARTFGVIRLADHGSREIFTPIFPAGTRLPRPGDPPVMREIEYAPHHDIGHLRYLECVGTDARGWPAEGVRFWSEIVFPYDPAIPVVGRTLALDAIAHRSDLAFTRVRETYSCSADGIITVRICRTVDGQARTFEVFEA